MVMRGGFLAVCCLGRVGLGRLGGLLLRKGWAADCRALVCGVVGLSGDWCRRHACCCLLGGGGCPRVLGACGGGMLSGFWGSAPWVARPVQGSISWGFGWVWVGWL